MKFTSSVLKKVESLVKEAGYTIRYEKGNFTPGYCLLEDKKVIVINTYYSTEAKTATLLELLTNLKINISDLTDEAKAFYVKIQQLEFK